MSERFLPFIIFGLLLCIVIGIPVTANMQESDDYNEHRKYVGENIVLNDDTVQVLEWRTGRYDNNRGYVLSNGLTVDELIVYKNVIYDGK